MPEVARFYGIVITMYFGDPARHPVPHFHARYGEYEATFAIDPPVWLAGVLPRRQVQLVLAWAELHREELLGNWANIVIGNRIHPIDGLK
jgi:hypothetical protein